ncbi:histidine phosphatase family protein [Nakamurella deserti]|uniref:histidine phosphatase family protein n=1 Tax=Nakamurella deserti TaxID=2164074 RepID=UPI00147935D5
MPTAVAPGRIVLIRHGETEWSATGRHTSVTDIHLTPHGEDQARRIPEILTALRVHPVTVLASPRVRARRTAELAGLQPEIEPDLAEWNYGDYEGLTTAQIRDARPGWSLFTDGAPGGDSPAAIGERADRVLHRARGLLAGGDVALVCHGHMSRVLAARWVGLDAGCARVLAQDPACVTVLGSYRGDPIIDHANVPPGPANASTGTPERHH